MNSTAKLFTHGCGQAVRSPKVFRFDGKEVRVRRVGDNGILEPMESGSMPWALIDQTGDSPFFPQGREQPGMPIERTVFDHSLRPIFEL